MAIEPRTGEILAFVSMPSFDPNLFVDGIDHRNWQALNGDPDRPLLNRPLRGTYPPGSTYKPFMDWLLHVQKDFCRFCRRSFCFFYCL